MDRTRIEQWIKYRRSLRGGGHPANNTPGRVCQHCGRAHETNGWYKFFGIID
jgi:hypothetical protein